MRFGVYGFGDEEVGFNDCGLGLKVQGSEFEIESVELRVQGLGPLIRTP